MRDGNVCPLGPSGVTTFAGVKMALAGLALDNFASARDGHALGHSFMGFHCHMGGQTIVGGVYVRPKLRSSKDVSFPELGSCSFGPLGS